MKKLISITVFLLLALAPGHYGILQGKLKDFADDVEKEEDRDSGSSSYSGSSGSDSCAGSCTEALAQVIMAAWIAHNLSVHYTDYPYSEKGSSPFVFYEPVQNQSRPEGMDTAMETRPPQPLLKKKNYYYIIESGGQWALDDGGGFTAALRGKFWKLIGPEMETRVLWDGEDHLAYYALGVNFPLVQASPCMLDMYVQASFMRGVLDRTGSSYGLILSSYPGKPVTFLLRLGGVSFEKITFMDVEGRLGFMVNRCEFFAGYRHLESDEARLGGPLAGVRVHF